MKDLVFVSNNQVVVSSRTVAEVFKREHKTVLASIRNILVAEKSATNLYREAHHKYRGREFSEYVMGRDGFMLLVMGFNTKDAIKLKKMFIDAFNDMELRLKNQVDVKALAKAVAKELQAQEHKALPTAKRCIYIDEVDAYKARFIEEAVHGMERLDTDSCSVVCSFIGGFLKGVKQKALRLAGLITQSF